MPKPLPYPQSFGVLVVIDPCPDLLPSVLKFGIPTIFLPAVNFCLDVFVKTDAEIVFEPTIALPYTRGIGSPCFTVLTGPPNK